MTLTAVEPLHHRWVTGFGCTHDAAETATDITRHRDWVNYLRSQQAPDTVDAHANR